MDHPVSRGPAPSTISYGRFFFVRKDQAGALPARLPASIIVLPMSGRPVPVAPLGHGQPKLCSPGGGLSGQRFRLRQERQQDRNSDQTYCTDAQEAGHVAESADHEPRDRGAERSSKTG